MKYGYVWEQHDHLYTLNSAASRSFQRFSPDFSYEVIIFRFVFEVYVFI